MSELLDLTFITLARISRFKFAADELIRQGTTKETAVVAYVGVLAGKPFYKRLMKLL